MSAVAPEELRRCILSSVPEDLLDVRVEPRFIYIPGSHLKALDPGRALVLGGRGTGKTFWWETLATDVGAQLLSILFDGRREGLTYVVSVGHGAKALAAGRALDADTLEALFKQAPERIVWKTVVLARVAPERIEALGSWNERVGWVRDHPEEAARILAEADEQLVREKRRHLVVFDAVDRTGPLWRDVVRAHRGLFSLLLELSGMRAIRAKAFVRQDILQDPDVMRFPDASKLLTAAAGSRGAGSISTAFSGSTSATPATSPARSGAPSFVAAEQRVGLAIRPPPFEGVPPIEAGLPAALVMRDAYGARHRPLRYATRRARFTRSIFLLDTRDHACCIRAARTPHQRCSTRCAGVPSGRAAQPAGSWPSARSALLAVPPSSAK